MKIYKKELAMPNAHKTIVKQFYFKVFAQFYFKVFAISKLNKVSGIILIKFHLKFLL